MVTCGAFFSESTVWSTACLLAPLSSVPLLALNTTGLVPLACWGSESLSTFFAALAPEPGMLRLSLVSRPIECDTTVRPAASTSQMAMTTQWWRAESPPSL